MLHVALFNQSKLYDTSQCSVWCHTHILITAIRSNLVSVSWPMALWHVDCRHADFGISGWLFCFLSHSSLMKWWSAQRVYRLAHAQRCCHLREPQQSWGFYIISDIVLQQMCWWCVDHNFLFVFYVFPLVLQDLCSLDCLPPVFLCFHPACFSLLLLPCICLISPLATLSIGCLDLSRVPNITSSQFLHQGSWPLSCVLLHQRSPLLYKGLLMLHLFLHLAMFHLFLSWYRLYFMCFLGYCGVCIFDVFHLCSYDSTPAPALMVRVN